MPEVGLKTLLYRWRVRAGLAGAVMILVLARPDPLSLIIGFAVCLPGLWLRTWASGHLKKNKELAVTGPYRYSRNPLYLGNMIIGSGFVIGSRSLWVLGVFIVYFFLFYPLIIRIEAEKMESLFPEEYGKYKAQTPSLFPFKRPFTSSKKNGFNWALYRKNKEWRALLGTIIFWLVLLGKHLFF